MGCQGAAGIIIWVVVGILLLVIDILIARVTGKIAEEKNISRAAVEDAIKKSISKLDQLEASLHILENNKNIEEIIKDLDDETKNKIEKVLDSYGI